MNNNDISMLMNAIETALLNNAGDNYLRGQAQKAIIYYRDTNPTEFFYNLSFIVGNDQLKKDIRQSAGTVASRCLALINNHTGNFYWYDVNIQARSQIKNNVLGCLISPEPQVMRAAASIIAAIASIQLPRNEWNNIIDTLAQNCTHQNQTIRKASITTMGFICQQIKKTNGTIQKRLCEQILGAIILCLRLQQASMITTCMKALQDSLSFLEPLIVQPKYRNVIFQTFTHHLSKDIEIQGTYNALNQFVKVAGPFLMEYKKILIDLATAHLQRKNQSSILNLQIWETIGFQYAQKQAYTRERVGDQVLYTNFLQNVADDILPSIMKCLLIENEQEDDQDLRMSAARVIQTFVKICDRKVVDMVTSAVLRIINSPQANQQQATVLLFSTISEYSDRQVSLSLFRDGFDHLFNLLNVPNKLVVKNSLIGFVRLAQSFPQVFLTHPNMSQIINQFYQFLICDVSQIRFISTQILVNISQGLGQIPQPVCDNPNILLTKIVKYYTTNMQRLQNEQKMVNEKLSVIIMNIVMRTNKRDIIINLIQFFIEQYFIVRKNDNIKNDRQLLLQQILSVLHTSILAHKDSIPNNQILNKICTVVNDQFQNNICIGQAYSLLGALATTFNKAFEHKALQYWDHIQAGLDQVNDLDTFKNALQCVGDYARMMESSFFNHASAVMKKLLGYIQQEMNRQIKLKIISCLGDLALSIQQYAQSFIPDLLKVMDISFSAVYELSNQQRDLDYTEQLKNSIIQLYSCIVFALSGKKASKQVIAHFGNLATFIVRTCDKSVQPTIQYLKNCLYLLHDSAAFYWTNQQNKEQIRNIINSPQVNELVRIIEKYSSRPDIKDLYDFINSRKNV